MKGRADIAIIGLGSAALQFAKIIEHLPSYSNKTIVFIDPNRGSSKAWCFWHKGSHPMDEFVSHMWDSLHFGHTNFQRTQNSSPYTYRHISSDNMYDWFFKELLPTKPLWRFEQASIVEVNYKNEGISLSGDKLNLVADIILDSRMSVDDFDLPLIWQHFRGFTIKSPQEIFNPSSATFMDFSLTTEQEDPSFVYVLPFSTTEALVETTVFSNHIWPSEKYDAITKNYIDTKWPNIQFDVEEIETGRIPMGFLKNIVTKDPRHIKIGGAGGCIKATTGYAFQRIFKQMNILAEELYAGGNFKVKKSRRYEFYDGLLLDIIQNEPKEVEKIMAKLFQKNSIESILNFLDEESSLFIEARIFSTLPFGPFLRAISRSRYK